MNDIFHKLLILRSPGIGPVKYAELIRQFGSAAAVCDSLRCDTKFIDSVRREMDIAAKMNIRYISDECSEYPENLRNIPNHPPVISARGNIDALRRRTVALVGTRHATGAGLRFMSDIAREFAQNNYAVASGMAMGTDTASHMGALSVPGDAQTIAVLAGGVDYIWPTENERLYHEIIERGCAISEMPVGFTPGPANFMRRNKWIAAVSEMLILGEADAKSGANATAEIMVSFGRPVYAVPSHPSDPRSMGPNRLIKEGKAIMCQGVQDFFENPKSSAPDSNKKNAPENDILSKLGNIPMPESVLAELVKKNVAEVKQELVVLELDGRVVKQDGGYVKT
ncbi:MAG: DNA-protecting protein DprA [Alphaproteobacteria bacterium]|nr:DNA-protecting protein DprA [Alphaproteobacteria bacterium]